jgi:hypothetical protein
MLSRGTYRFCRAAEDEDAEDETTEEESLFSGAERRLSVRELSVPVFGFFLPFFFFLGLVGSPSASFFFFFFF